MHPMTTPDHDGPKSARRERAPYHLDIAFDGGCLLLQVDGPPDPRLREHVAEVRRAAAECGLDVVVTGGEGCRPGRLV